MVRSGVPRGPRTSFGTGWGIGGLVGDALDPEAVAVILEDVAKERSLFTHIRPNPLQGAIWAEANAPQASNIPRRAHVLDLSGGADATWRRLRKSGRRGINKAEKAGVEVTRHVGGDMLDRYYEELYLASLERWAARQREPLALSRFRSARRDPITRLHTIARTLGDDFMLYLAWVDGRAAAGTIVLASSQNAHATRGAMNYELANKASAAYAIEWAAIKDACKAGNATYHMGESGRNASLADYKERFGAAPFDYDEYRIERLPLLRVDQTARAVVKKLIGFKDT